jgi:UDP-N-acetylglucosamine transferase subunit ALG13
VHGVVAFDRLAEWAAAADVIITHGGPGSILLALSVGRSPVVVPRDPRFGEHVDDHQLRFVRWLQERAPIRPIYDLAELGRALTATASMVAGDGTLSGSRQEAIERLRRAIEDDGRR